VPPVNQQRRDALADAAIAIVAREGTHGLSHRSVDEAAEVPKGTTSNYFRSRDALLEATVNRVVQLHFEWINELRAKHEGELDRAALLGILAQVLDEAVTVHKDRYRAMMELLLESTRRPDLHVALAQTFNGTIEMIKDVHRTQDVEPTGREVHMLRILYVGTLFGYIVLPETMQALTPGETAKTIINTVLTA
jgi:DNA-binding transcriptional regulator YbjK